MQFNSFKSINGTRYNAIIAFFLSRSELLLKIRSRNYMQSECLTQPMCMLGPFVVIFVFWRY